MSEESAIAPLIQDSPLPAQPLVRPPADYLHPNFQDLDHCRTVAFFHPGYVVDGTRHDPAVELLRLPAYDNSGLHLGTALSAMRIIAYNKSGYLTIDTPKGCRVEESWDYVLPGEKNYYYHLDSTTAGHRYPICSTFTDWPFEPSTIPHEWRSAFNLTSSSITIVAGSQMSSGVRARDVSCRITGSPDATDNAHIIPRAELIWFLNNGLHVYTRPPHSPSPSAIDDVQNGILLRKDMHYLFDQRLFTPVVKAQVLVSHYLQPTNAAALYHNAQVRLPPAVQPVEFFWARFAWSIIPYVGPFDERVSQIPRLQVPAEEGDAVRNTRKRKTATRAPSTRKGGGSRATEKRGAAVDDTEDLDPTAVPAWQLEQEMERDSELQQHFFPDMSKYPPSHEAMVNRADQVIEEETTWSGDATWQFASWYPGMQHTERVKSWWRANHPQIGEEGGQNGS